MRKYSKRTTVIAVTTAILLGTAGGAYAYWTSTGSGTGTATAGTATTLKVVQGGTAITGLVPGGNAQPLSGTFTNADGTANTSVKVTSLTTSVAVDKTGCLPADFIIGGTLSITTDANNASQSWTGLTIKLNNTASNQDPCKTALVTVTYSAS